MASLTQSASFVSELGPLAPTWRSWSGVHGGYLAAATAGVALDAEQATVRGMQLLFMSAAPAQTPLQVLGSHLRRGRSSSLVRASVIDGDRPLMEATYLCGASGQGLAHERPSAPAVPEPQACERFDFPVDLVPFSQHLEVRPANAARPLAGGSHAELLAWVRTQALGLHGWQTVTVLLDALPPGLYAVATSPDPIPTVSMSAFLAPAASKFDPCEWALVRIRTEEASQGWAIETSTVWSAQGSLLGTATQTRRVLSWT